MPRRTAVGHCVHSPCMGARHFSQDLGLVQEHFFGPVPLPQQPALAVPGLPRPLNAITCWRRVTRAPAFSPSNMHVSVTIRQSFAAIIDFWHVLVTGVFSRRVTRINIVLELKLVVALPFRRLFVAVTRQLANNFLTRFTRTVGYACYIGSVPSNFGLHHTS